MFKIMVEEANRFARQMRPYISEDLPITRSNIAGAHISPPSAYIHMHHIGALDTRKYSYEFAPGKGVTSVNKIDNNFASLWAEYDRPSSLLHTNRAFREALEIMRKANIDVDAINRDSVSIDISASMSRDRRHFIPVYWISWLKAATNVIFGDPGGRRVAFFVFLEPTETMFQLDIFSPKYIVRKALETPDLFALLTTDPTNNPPWAVRREIESGTNTALWRQIVLEGHPSEKTLKAMGLTQTNVLGQANRPAKR